MRPQTMRLMRAVFRDSLIAAIIFLVWIKIVAELFQKSPKPLAPSASNETESSLPELRLPAQTPAEERPLDLCGSDVDLLREAAYELYDTSMAFAAHSEADGIIQLRIRSLINLLGGRQWRRPNSSNTEEDRESKITPRKKQEMIAMTDESHFKNEKFGHSILSSELTAVWMEYKVSALTYRRVEGPLKFLRAFKLPIMAIIHEESNFTEKYTETQVWNANAHELLYPANRLNAELERLSNPFVLLARDAARVDGAARLHWLVHRARTFRRRLSPQALKIQYALWAERVARSGEENYEASGENWAPIDDAHMKLEPAVVGGAVRDARGRWSHGCVQMRLSHYALRFREGYRQVLRDCVRCDYLRGPFVAPLSLLRRIPFTSDLPREVMYVDWFLRLKFASVLVVSCPESMFHIRGSVEDVDEASEVMAKGLSSEWTSRAAWQQLGIYWELHEMHPLARPPLKFTCKEVDITCKFNDDILVPRCCLDLIHTALKDLETFASQNRFSYELSGKALMSAVKMGSIMPWKTEGELVVDPKHNWMSYDIHYVKNSSYFEYFSVNNESRQCSMFRAAYLKFPVYCIAFRNDMLPEGLRDTPTKTRVNGLWMRAFWNPGLYVRYTQGVNYLKNIHHITCSFFDWRDKPPTDLPRFQGDTEHGCLSQYPDDGNLGFYLPNS